MLNTFVGIVIGITAGLVAVVAEETLRTVIRERIRSSKLAQG